jgi:hypothetical protein
MQGARDATAFSGWRQRPSPSEATDPPAGPDAVVERRGRSGSMNETSRPAVAAAPGSAVASPAAAAATSPRRRWPRRLLLALGLAATLGGALCLYLSGGALRR